MYKEVARVLAVLFTSAGPLLGQTTFAGDVAPILFAKCSQCHRPEGSAPFSLLTYSSARTHATQIALVTKSRVMPPWKAAPQPDEFIGLDPLSDAEIAIIQRWVADGAPEGDRNRLPPPPRESGGWQLGSPDLIVSLPQPYVLPAEGPDVSRVFVLPLPVDRLRHVSGIEFRPGNSRIHHANLRIDATPASRQLDAQDPAPGYDGIIVRSATFPDGHFLGWTPGQAAPLLPKGLAWNLAPTSDLVVQLHMVPSGKPERIQPSIGLYFTDEGPTQTPVMLRLSNQDIDIGAGERDYVARDAFVLPAAVDVLALQPHAHYLAREVMGIARLPDGTTRTLVSIPDWDLRWQHVYRFATPVSLPGGTSVEMRIRYDNSTANSRNPANPPVRVEWGQQSREEMGDFWLQVMPQDPRDRELVDRTFRAKWMATDVVGLESLIRREPARASLRDDIGVLYMELNRPAEAIPHFEAAMKLKPGVASGPFNYGTALAAAGRLEAAVTQYRQALALRPDYAIAYNNLGNALLQLGQVQPARRSFEEAARIEPRLAEAQLNVGLLARASGDFREAATRFRLALTPDPNWPSAAVSLASLLAAAPDPSVRNPAEAIRVAERAVDVTLRRDPTTLDTLAVAHAAAGNFERALAIEDEALALEPSPELAATIREHQGLFRAGRAYVAAW
jgi:tetratricopeptide (TPR) repeat protein